MNDFVARRRRRRLSGSKVLLAVSAADHHSPTRHDGDDTNLKLDANRCTGSARQQTNTQANRVS